MNHADQSSKDIIVSAPENRSPGRLQNYYTLVTTNSAKIAPPITLLAAVLTPCYFYFSKWEVPYLASGAIFLATFGLLLLGLNIRRAGRPFEPGIFRGPFEPTPDTSWERVNELDELRPLVERTNGEALVIFGPSGVGKSHILSVDVCAEFAKNGWIPIQIKAYSGIYTELQKAVRLSFASHGDIPAVDNRWGGDKDLLLILDQFEQFIDHSTPNDHDWLRKFCVSSLNNAKFHLIIAVRQDWSRPCQLLLKGWGIKTVEYDLLGIDSDSNLASGQLTRNMRDACGDSDTAQKALNELAEKNRILPVAAQIVGLGLENLGRMKDQIVTVEDFDKLGGTQGIIQSFFDRLIDSSPNRDTSRAVLFALSVHNALHVIPKLTRLIAATHHHPHRIRACVRYFQEYRLINESSDGFVALTHDYYAEKLREITGRSLSSGERDNIAYFSENLAPDTKSDTLSIPDERTTLLMMIGAGWALVAGVHSIRLFGPSVGLRFDWGITWPVWLAEWLSVPIDLYGYLIWASTVAMATYILFLYKRVLVNLKEPMAGWIFSVFILVIMALGGAFLITNAPQTWALVISMSGVLVGMKFLLLGYFAGHSMGARNFFLQEAIKILWLCLFFAGGGVIYIWYVKTTPISEEMLVGSNLVIFVGSALILVSAWRAWNAHVALSSAAEILGKFDRGKPIARRSE